MRVYKLILVIGLLAAGTLAAPTLAATESFIDQYAVQAGAVASLDPVQGLVQRHAADAAGDGWQTVTQRELVGVGDQIRTNAEGLAVLTFFAGAESEIFPNSVIEVQTLEQRDDGTFTVTLEMLVGNTLNRVETLAHPESRYEVHTPNAVITVRGTEFWIAVFRQGLTEVGVLDGAVVVEGLNLQGAVVSDVVVEAGFVVGVFPEGEIGPLSDIGAVPEAPPAAPLAEPSCGDGACEAREEAHCPMDCGSFPECGDGECNPAAGEDVTTCPADCVSPGETPPEEGITYLHFFWGEMRCDLDPLPDRREGIHGPILAHWGIGCFDSSAHASMHPHPADYQMTVDGEPFVMGSLRMSGPHVHDPYCPWGWSFELGPFELPPGEHTLALVETVTDTWSGESGGRNAGEVVTLTCTIVVAP